MEAIAGTMVLRIGAVAVGCVTEPWAERAQTGGGPFRSEPDGLVLEAAPDDLDGRTRALERWALQLRAEGALPGWRGERVAIRGPLDDAPLAFVERALLRPLGLMLRSVQACVWTLGPDGPRLWISRRGWHKPVDPGRLDALVAGGIAGLDDPAATLLRECAEEAGLPEALARRAQPAGTIELCRLELDAGLPVVHRERVTVHELELPPGIRPVPVDGEHAEILSMTPAEALASIGSDPWTADGAQATLDLIHRRGWLAPGRADGAVRGAVEPDAA